LPGSLKSIGNGLVPPVCVWSRPVAHIYKLQVQSDSYLSPARAEPYKPHPAAQNCYRAPLRPRQVAVAASAEHAAVERQGPKPEDHAHDEELANLYEHLVLHDVAIPVDLFEAMRAAYRRVHLQGVDPLRRVA
jgi:hypothetical protein